MNKNYKNWIKPVVNRPVVNQSQGSGQSVPRVVVYRPPTKETLTKETNTKEIDIQSFFSIPENIEKLKTKFPLIDIDLEIERMIDWRKNNKKRIIDYMAFARNWLRNNFGRKKESPAYVDLSHLGEKKPKVHYELTENNTYKEVIEKEDT